MSCICALKLSPGRALSAITATAVLACWLALSTSPAAAFEAYSYGRQYRDYEPSTPGGVDSRKAAENMTLSLRRIGYSTTFDGNGRGALQAYEDGTRANVWAFFGHSDAGQLMLDDTDPARWQMANASKLQEGTFGALDSFMWSQWAGQANDMFAAILAGCFTAVESNKGYGNFMRTGYEQGVDTIIGFNNLVYFASDTTDRSSNYFWRRFGEWAETGMTHRDALNAAASDLWQLEGTYKGWNDFFIGGNSPSPPYGRLSPAKSGQLYSGSQAATTASTSPPRSTDLEAMTPERSFTTADGDQSLLRYIESSDGVSYRTNGDGDLVTLSAPNSAHGPVTYNDQQAIAVATDYVQRHISWFDPGNVIRAPAVRTRHAEGEELLAVSWRTSVSGVKGPGYVAVEVDLRNGNVTSLMAHRVVPPTTRFQVSRDDAARTALMAAGESAELTDIDRDIWHRPRWTLTVTYPSDSGPRLKHLTVDGETGEITDVDAT